MTTKKVPKKLYYKIGEVCEITDTQPYVLRFWESEFPQLAPEKNRSGQRIYRKQDIGIVERIKHLLHDEGYTIAGARKRLDQEQGGEDPGPPLEMPEEVATPAQARQERSPEEPPAGPDASGRIREAVSELREILERMRLLDEKLDRLS